MFYSVSLYIQLHVHIFVLVYFKCKLRNNMFQRICQCSKCVLRQHLARQDIANKLM